MRYVALVTDYDGTIAHHGRVDESTIRALEQVRISGRRLVLVTGREVDDLWRAIPELALFDRVVAENGGVLYTPADRSLQALGPPPADEFVRELRRRGVSPLSTGHVIVSTWEPQETTVLEVIRDLALELQVIFNKGAVMVLPSGINKATGLRRALTDLGLSQHNAVGIGDAENDQAFLSGCECAVAVANALDSVKQRVDLVTAGDHGAGVVELIEALLRNDLKELDVRLSRHDLLLGHAADGEEVRVPASGAGMLIAGPSGSGKTTVMTSFLEQAAAAAHQYCIVDPEGDYEGLAGSAALTGSDPRTLAESVLEVLARPDQSVAVNLLDLRLEERPEFFAAVLTRLHELRAATGRPHWIVIDEAHHLLPATWQPAATVLPGGLRNVVLVTVHPDHVAAPALAQVNRLVIVGRDPAGTAAAFARGRGTSFQGIPNTLAALDAGEAWLLDEGSEPTRFKVLPPKSSRQRHRRKYAEGELGPDKSFYFRGPENRLNLRAQNLMMFAQLAEGVDDDTWMHHLRRGDYSTWMTSSIKDEALADQIRTIEQEPDLTPAESREQVLAAIRERYTTAL